MITACSQDGRMSRNITGGAISAWQFPVEHSKGVLFLSIPVQFVPAITRDLFGDSEMLQ